MTRGLAFAPWVGVIAALVWPPGSPGRQVHAADAQQTQIEVRLYEAVWQKGDGQVKGGPTLMLLLTRNGDRWGRVVGLAGDLNTALHTGIVERGEASDQAVALAVSMDLFGDNWVPGGRGEFAIALKATAERAFEGTYTGSFRGVAVRGRAEGRLLPPPKRLSTYPQPIAPGEHPRLLFRKSDLAALREKAKTPFGQAVLAKADDAISLGIQYQLTGNLAFAQRARQLVEQFLGGDYKAARVPGSHHGIYHYGYVWEHPAVAYDLCYDAWDEAFKRRVERYIVLWAERILWQRGLFNTQGQYTYGNGEAGSLYYGTALGALALLGEKGPEPLKPAGPDPVAEVPPAAGYQPGKDVPLLALEPGKSPTAWLATKPVPAIVADPLKELGGAEKCRPAVGTAFTFEGTTYEFQPLPREFIPEGGGVCLNLGKSIEQGHVKRSPGPEMAKDGPITLCVYTVLDNAEPRLLKVTAPFSRWGHQQFVLAGHTLAHGQVAKLQKGLYPLLVILRVKARWNSPQPRLELASEQDLQASKALLARLQQEHTCTLKDWEHDLAEWKRSGGCDQELQRLFDVTRYLMYLQCRESVGTGGAQSVTSAESYELGLHPALYASAYRNCFGTDLSPFGDITHTLPRRVFTHIYPDQGQPFSQEIHGPTEIGMDYFAYNFPVVPEEWKPAILWAWNRHAGLAGEPDAARLLAGAKWYTPPRLFLNYPLGMEPKPPKGILPLTWEAPDFGYYGFRSGWQGKDDFLVQAWLRSDRPKGYHMPNAGTFRILGLGHEWVIGYPTVRLDNRRYFDPVVLLPEDATNDDGPARATYVKMEKDGSGALTADLNDVYCRKVEFERYGNVRRDATYQDSGIRGLRAYAVDFSGKSGAPCLFVLVDKITGGKSKVCPWYLGGVKFGSRTGKVADSGEDFKKTQIQGNAATVSGPDGATMKLTFVAPADPVVKAEVRTLKFQQTYNRGEASFTAPGIFASGADPADGNFFVVVTIQRGQAPEVKSTGKGLDAKVTVGGRTVRFDGSRILLE